MIIFHLKKSFKEKLFTEIRYCHLRKELHYQPVSTINGNRLSQRAFNPQKISW